jgi:hypothetical protein
VPKIPSVSRRTFITAGSVATAVGALELTGGLSIAPNRAAAATLTPSDIQFDVGQFIAPAQTWDGVTFQMPPVHTVYLTAKLTHHPNKAGRQVLTRALNQLEKAYPWSAAGLITFVAYGLPYFNRLDQDLVASMMPRLVSDNTRWATGSRSCGTTCRSSSRATTC